LYVPPSPLQLKKFLLRIQNIQFVFPALHAVKSSQKFWLQPIWMWNDYRKVNHINLISDVRSTASTALAADCLWFTNYESAFTFRTKALEVTVNKEHLTIPGLLLANQSNCYFDNLLCLVFTLSGIRCQQRDLKPEVSGPQIVIMVSSCGIIKYNYNQNLWQCHTKFNCINHLPCYCKIRCEKCDLSSQ